MHDIKEKIVNHLKSSRFGASSSEISKAIHHNRITVTKYLEIMKAEGLINYEDVAQAKLWYLAKAGKPNVLVVDDEPHVTNLVSLSLIPNKYNVMKAYSGPEALEKAEKHLPQVIVLDLMMPGMNGFEVCKRLRENSLTSHIPIIILSAKGELEDKLRSLKTGADDYVTKPFDPMELEARVERIVRKAGKDLDSHPLTKLPGIEAIRERIDAAGPEELALRISVSNLEKYAASYGYKRSEHLIYMLSRVIADNAKGAFIGHTVKDMFVVVTNDEKIEKRITASLEKIKPYVKGSFEVERKACNAGRPAEAVLNELGVV